MQVQESQVTSSSRSGAGTSPMATSKRELVIWWAPIPDTAQEQFFTDATTEAAVIFMGGWGAGKTMTLTGKMLKLSAINAPLPIIWVVPRFDHILKTVLPQLEDIDQRSGNPWFLGAGQFHYHKSDHILTWEG